MIRLRSATFPMLASLAFRPPDGPPLPGAGVQRFRSAPCRVDESRQCASKWPVPTAPSGEDVHASVPTAAPDVQYGAPLRERGAPRQSSADSGGQLMRASNWDGDPSLICCRLRAIEVRSGATRGRHLDRTGRPCLIRGLSDSWLRLFRHLSRHVTVPNRRRAQVHRRAQGAAQR